MHWGGGVDKNRPFFSVRVTAWLSPLCANPILYIIRIVIVLVECVEVAY